MPLLTAGLVKIGEAIYLPAFPASGGAPKLLHIWSEDDLALLGVDAANYGQLVLDRFAWEQRYGFNTDALPIGDFSTGAMPAADPAPAATESTSSETVPADGPIAESDVPVMITVPEHPDHPNYTVPIPE
jgi:hypothetical protein